MTMGNIKIISHKTDRTGVEPLVSENRGETQRGTVVNRVQFQNQSSDNNLELKIELRRMFGSPTLSKMWFEEHTCRTNAENEPL